MLNMTNLNEESGDRPLFDRAQVTKAVHAVYQFVAKKKNKDLIEEPEKIHLQLTFKKASTTRKTIQIALPTSLVTKTSEVCLFVKDLDKKERDYSDTVRHYKDLLNSKGIKSVTEVIPLKSVKTEYKPFEAKRNLSDSFDVYLADDRILRLLPSLLGKHFYGRKKFPVAVKLTAKDLKTKIDEALGCAQCILTGRGSNSQVTVAHTELTEEQAVDNILAAAERLAQTIPAGHDNIRVLHIRTDKSPALPIYASLGSSVDIKLPKRWMKREQDDPEDVTTVMHGKVQVTASGHIRVINKATAAFLEKRPRKVKPKKRLAGKKPLKGGDKKKASQKIAVKKMDSSRKVFKSEPGTGKAQQSLKSKSRKRKLSIKTE